MVSRSIVVAGFALFAVIRPGVCQVPRDASSADTVPVVFGPGVLSAGEVYRGSFAPDGKEFYFFRKIGPGEVYHILRATYATGSWSEPQRVILGGAEHSDLYPST